MNDLIEQPKDEIEFVKNPVDKMEEWALSTGVEDLIPQHMFSDGVYVRAVRMTADKPLIIGHKHNTRHLNVVMTGKAIVSMGEGTPKLVKAPCVFESKAGVRKSLYILEDMIWLTVHPNQCEEEYTQEMEDHFITKTDNFKEFEKERDMLLEAIEREDQ